MTVQSFILGRVICYTVAYVFSCFLLSTEKLDFYYYVGQSYLYLLIDLYTFSFTLMKKNISNEQPYKI